MMRADDLIGGGLGIALVTPFCERDGIDDDALGRLVQHVAAGGADFLVALGSTGEASMLDAAERDHAVRIAMEHKGGARLVVGATAASTRETCGQVEAAAAAGADAALVAAPPYTKPTQAGIVAHFDAIRRAVPQLPLIAYNVPSRTGVNITVETACRLCELPNVVAIKESSGDLTQIARVAASLPAGRALLAGDDALTLPTMAVGGRGVVSVAGNAVPERMAELVRAATAGDLTGARSCHRSLMPLFDALCAEPNPIPIKAALAAIGIGRAEPRLPLLTATDATRETLRRAMFQLPGVLHHA